MYLAQCGATSLVAPVEVQRHIDELDIVSSLDFLRSDTMLTWSPDCYTFQACLTVLIDGLVLCDWSDNDEGLVGLDDPYTELRCGRSLCGVQRVSLVVDWTTRAAHCGHAGRIDW